MNRVRTCGPRCHQAESKRCACWCGGVFHGRRGAGARRELIGALTELGLPPVLPRTRAEYERIRGALAMSGEQLERGPQAWQHELPFAM